MTSKATISPKNERILHTKSGNCCAMCGIILVDEANVCIGENAHIYGEKPTAARYNPNLSSDFVNSEENLIFLCCNCHKIIDSNPDQYSADTLLELKKNHEQKVRKTSNIPFLTDDVNNALRQITSLVSLADNFNKNYVNYKVCYNERTDIDVYNRCVDMVNSTIQLNDFMWKYYLQLDSIGYTTKIEEVINFLPEFYDATDFFSIGEMPITITNFLMCFCNSDKYSEYVSKCNDLICNLKHNFDV